MSEVVYQDVASQLQSLTSNKPTRRVLLVEDNIHARTAMRLLFRRTNAELIEAETIAEGFKKLFPLPDWVILDLMLPTGDDMIPEGSTGALILEKIRVERLPVKVVITTGMHIEDLKLNGSHPDAILQKPYHVADLLRLVGVSN